MINKICYYHPQIVKNEIEYLHKRIWKPVKKDEKAKDTIETEEQKEEETKYERVFTTRNGKRFKFIVDQG